MLRWLLVVGISAVYSCVCVFNQGVASRQTALTKAEEEEAAEEYSHLNTAEV